jgi:hypothetical protein
MNGGNKNAKIDLRIKLKMPKEKTKIVLNAGTKITTDMRTMIGIPHREGLNGEGIS